MRQIVIGSHNPGAPRFIGSVAVGEWAANFLTLVSSAIRNEVDVY